MTERGASVISAAQRSTGRARMGDGASAGVEHRSACAGRPSCFQLQWAGAGGSPCAPGLRNLSLPARPSAGLPAAQMAACRFWDLELRASVLPLA